MSDQWIKFSERWPQRDCAYWIYRPDQGIIFAMSLPWLQGYAEKPDGWEWQPATVPEPPKGDQLALDNAAMCAWYDRKHYEGSIIQTETWHAAIAYEREQVRALLEGCVVVDHDGRNNRVLFTPDAWGKLVRRISFTP